MVKLRLTVTREELQTMSDAYVALGNHRSQIDALVVEGGYLHVDPKTPIGNWVLNQLAGMRGLNLDTVRPIINPLTGSPRT